MCSNDIFLGVLAVLFPPLPVWVKSGLCSADSLINILLCLLGYLPGLLHAWYIIAKHPDPFDYHYDPQHQHHAYEPVPGAAPHNPRVAYEYVYVRSPPPQGGMHYPPAASPHQAEQSYLHQGQQHQQPYPQGQYQQSYPQQGHQHHPQQHEYSQQHHHHVQDGMNYGTAGAWAQHQGSQDYSEREREAEGSNAPPPPYTPLPGDHKIQTRE